jgi:ElaA protein
MSKTYWYIKHFKELSAKEFHQLIQLREAVFVVEQDCPYLDVDGKDLDAFHIWAENQKGEILCTSRILKQGVSYPEVSIGRVCTSVSGRGKNLGKDMMNKCSNFIETTLKTKEIRISAQTYLLKFYNELGYESTGKEYLEDDIPHVEMIKS